MNKEQRESANEHAGYYRLYLDKAILYAECLNAVAKKKIVDIEPLYEKLIEAQGLVLKGVKDE